MSESDAERLLAARITGTAARYARGRPLSEAEEAEALASLIELAAGRTDLLAQVAGLAIGFSEGAPDEPRQQQAARLLIKAGADQGLIPAWVEVGRRRAEAAKGIPYAGDP
jgi:HEAT repeat protein